MEVCPHEKDQDFCSISGLSEQGSINPNSSSDLAFLSFLEVPTSCPFEGQMCSDVHQCYGNYIELKIESNDNYLSCGMDIEYTEEFSDVPSFTDGSFNLLMTEAAPNTALQRKNGLQVGAKILQFVMDCYAMLLKTTSREKCTTERGLEAANYRFQRYKRSTSFNSRSIVIFSSLLSSMGTIALIYLTLRAKHFSDGLVRV